MIRAVLLACCCAGVGGAVRTQDFRVLNSTLLPASLANPFHTASAFTSTGVVLVWTVADSLRFAVHDRQLKLVRTGTLPLCLAPQAEALAGAFAIACISRTGVMVAVLSAEGVVEKTDSIEAQEVEDLRLQSVALPRVACTFSASGSEGKGVFLVLIDRNGAGAPTRISLFVQGSQRRPLATAADSGFYVLWESVQPGSALRRQHFTDLGARSGSEDTLSNHSHARLAAHVDVEGKGLYLLTKENWGESEVLVSELHNGNFSLGAICGLPRPIWRIKDVYLAAIHEERLLMGLSYSGADGKYRSELLAFAPAGCYFSTYSFLSSAGDVRIAGLTQTDEWVEVVTVDSLGFSVWNFSTPTASVCLRAGATVFEVQWSRRRPRARGVPEVLAVTASIVALSALLAGAAWCCRRRTDARLETAQIELSFSKSSITIEEEKVAEH